MRVDRLRMLLRVGERVRSERLPFDMRVWVNRPSYPEDIASEDICGSAGCIVGWAARDPEVIASGLRLCSLDQAMAASEKIQMSPGLAEQDEIAWQLLFERVFGSPVFGEFSGLGAVVEWLECSQDEARRLVLSDYYDAPTHDVPVWDVIARLRDTIAWHERQLVPGAES